MESDFSAMNYKHSNTFDTALDQGVRSRTGCAPGEKPSLANAYKTYYRKFFDAPNNAYAF